MGRNCQVEEMAVYLLAELERKAEEAWEGRWFGGGGGGHGTCHA